VNQIALSNRMIQKTGLTGHLGINKIGREVPANQRQYDVLSQRK
jgi:hypothetical protein